MALSDLTFDGRGVTYYQCFGGFVLGDFGQPQLIRLPGGEPVTLAAVLVDCDEEVVVAGEARIIATCTIERPGSRFAATLRTSSRNLLGNVLGIVTSFEASPPS